MSKTGMKKPHRQYREKGNLKTGGIKVREGGVTVMSVQSKMVSFGMMGKQHFLKILTETAVSTEAGRAFQ